MNKNFAKRMLDKPEPYLKVWVFIYANSNDEGCFYSPYTFMLSRFKISRTTLQRIIDTGIEYWAESGQKVGRKWAGKELIVNFEQSFSGQKVGRKWAESGQKKDSKKNENNDVFASMVLEYDLFCKRVVGVGAKMNQVQGKALKNIIKYLLEQIRQKNGDLLDSEIMEQCTLAWKLILDNWDKIDDFYSKQIKLTQIDSNLPNILIQIKNKKTYARDAKFADTHQQVGRINFE